MFRDKHLFYACGTPQSYTLGVRHSTSQSPSSSPRLLGRYHQLVLTAASLVRTASSSGTKTVARPFCHQVRILLSVTERFCQETSLLVIQVRAVETWSSEGANSLICCTSSYVCPVALVSLKSTAQMHRRGAFLQLPCPMQAGTVASSSPRTHDKGA